jgi:hypothetical protein
MHTQQGAGSDLMDRRGHENVPASGGANRIADHEIAVELAAGLLELDAEIAVLRLDTAVPHQGLPTLAMVSLT